MSDTLRQGRSSPPHGTARRPAPVLAGVASDTAVRLGVDPVVVRLALVVLTAAGGAGVLLYGILWLRRASDPRPPVPAPPVDAAGALGLALALGGLLLCGARQAPFASTQAVPSSHDGCQGQCRQRSLGTGTNSVS